MSKESRLGLVLSINLAMIAALAVTGFLAHSLGVLASAADYVGDAAGVALSLFALRLSRNGRSRATSLAALANSSFLLAVTLAVAGGACARLVSGSPEVHGLPVLVVSLVAVAAMVACALILGEVEAGDLNMSSVMLDTLADAAAAAGVAVSGAIILASGGLYWLDSAVALTIACVVGYHAVRLILACVADLRAAGGAPPA